MSGCVRINVAEKRKFCGENSRTKICWSVTGDIHFWEASVTAEGSTTFTSSFFGLITLLEVEIFLSAANSFISEFTFLKCRNINNWVEVTCKSRFMLKT